VDLIRQEYFCKVKEEYAKIEDIKNANLDEKKRLQMKFIEM
jgi:hypothetical protein